MVVWAFFACEGLGLWVVAQVFFDDLIAENILMQLLVAELVGGLEHDHRRVPQHVGYLNYRVQQRTHHRGLLALHLRPQILHATDPVLQAVEMLTTQSPAGGIPQKFKRELKTEDFLLLTQENKEYRQLLKVLTEREAILAARLPELEQALARAENERDEYKAASSELACRLHTYENIKNELLQEYRLLREQIDRTATERTQLHAQLQQLQKSNEELQESVVVHEQRATRDGLVIEELRAHTAKLERELVDKKIKLFSQMIECPNKENEAVRANRGSEDAGLKATSHFRSRNSAHTYSQGNSNTHSSSNSHTHSSSNSNNQSISFSLVSNDTPSRKPSKVKHVP